MKSKFKSALILPAFIILTVLLVIVSFALMSNVNKPHTRAPSEQEKVAINQALMSKISGSNQSGGSPAVNIEYFDGGEALGTVTFLENNSSWSFTAKRSGTSWNITSYRSNR